MTSTCIGKRYLAHIDWDTISDGNIIYIIDDTFEVFDICSITKSRNNDIKWILTSESGVTHYIHSNTLALYATMCYGMCIDLPEYDTLGIKIRKPCAGSGIPKVIITGHKLQCGDIIPGDFIIYNHEPRYVTNIVPHIASGTINIKFRNLLEQTFLISDSPNSESQDIIFRLQKLGG